MPDRLYGNEVFVHVNGRWARGRTCARRRVGRTWEAQVRYVERRGDQLHLEEGWFDTDLIRDRHESAPPLPGTPDGSSMGDIAVDVEIAGTWVRGHAHGQRSTADSTQILVAYLDDQAGRLSVAEAWFDSRHVRPAKG